MRGPPLGRTLDSMGRISIGVVLAAAAAAVAVSGAGAETYRLGWAERHSEFGRHVVLTYEVRSLTFGRGWWRASVAVRNETNLRIRLHRGFALLAVPAGDERALVLPARSASTSLPRVIPILGTWRGTVDGPGVPPAGALLRLRFGTTSVVILPNHRITHTTTHALRR
jgi:hypothetical protein